MRRCVPNDSALLLLSGADVALVDAAHGDALGRWLGRSASPPTSVSILPPAMRWSARGGEALGLAQLPDKLLQRWPA